MDFEGVNNKQLQDIERLAKELLEAMRKAKLGEEPIYKDLVQLIEQAGGVRRARFDDTDTGYKGY
jgi:hypothetical protein